MDKETWQWFKQSILVYRGRLIAFLLSVIFLGAIGASIPFLLQQLVDDALAGSFNTFFAVLFVSAIILSSIPIAFMQRSRLRNRYRYDLRGKFLEHIFQMDMSFHENRGSTIVATQAMKGINAAGTIINILGSGQVIVQTPVALFSIYYIGTHSILAASLLLGFFVLFIFIGKQLGERIYTCEEEHQDIDTKILHRQREAIQQIATVKVHHAEESELAHYWDTGKTALFLRNKLANMYGLLNFLGQGANGFAYIVVIILFLPHVIDGTMTAGVFFALSMYATRALAPVQYLGDYYSELKQNSAALVPIIEMLKVQPQITEEENALTLPPLRNEIILSNISFHYPEKTKEVLHSVTIHIQARKKTAIVGSSGSGKTTLARLITRLYDPTKGTIEFDGINLKQVSLQSLYKEISYLSQEVPIFTGTVEENVAYGMSEYSEADVLNALKKASAEFVHIDEEGIRTMIGEMGKKLSGGERQRIALARIFMRNPSIVILDEATSALDTVTEATVHGMFEELSKLDGGKTMIIIAHRLSTVRNADQIVVLEKGVVLDIGTHDELLTRCEVYQKLNATFVV